jgi:hypothetical protein
MGRYLGGSDDFEYKYAFGEQPSNLAYLHGVSGVGSAFFDVAYEGELEDGNEDLVDMGEMRISKTADPRAVFASLVARESRRAKRIRAAFAEEHGATPKHVTLEASVFYQLRDRDWGKLAAWIASRCRRGGKGVDVAAIAAGGGEEVLALVEREERKPRLPIERRLATLGAYILVHAVEHDLATMKVWENDTEWCARL